MKIGQREQHQRLYLGLNLGSFLRALFLGCFFCMCLGFDFFGSFSYAESPTLNRLNQIFYWQIADELKLSAATEKKMVEALSSIQKERERMLQERESLFVEAHKGSLSGKLFSSRYEAQVAGLSKLDITEHAALKKILSPEELMRFYLIRDSLSKKVRDALKKRDL